MKSKRLQIIAAAVILLAGALAASGAHENKGAITKAPALEVKPDLDLTRVVLARVDLNQLEAEMVIGFSKPVNENSLREKLAVWLNGKDSEIAGLRRTGNEIKIKAKLPNPGTTNVLTVEVKPGVLSRAGDSQTAIEYTRWFDLKDFAGPNQVTVRLVKSDLAQGELDLIFAFAERVEEISFRNALALFWNEQPIKPAEVKTGAAINEIQVKIKVLDIDKDNKLRVVLDNRVKTAAGRGALSAEITREFAVPAAGALTIYRVSANEDENSRYVGVEIGGCQNGCYFDEQSLRNKVHVEPRADLAFSSHYNEVRLHGDFRAGEYTVVVDKGLISRGGYILAQSYSRKFTVGKMAPRVSFAAKGRYLPRNMISAVPVRHRNVKEVSVEVRQVPEQNLVFWFSKRSEDTTNRDSELVAMRNFPVAGEDDKEKTSWLDLSGLLPKDARGVFEFSLMMEGYARDSLRLNLTELDIVVKKSGDDGREILAWAMDARSLKPAKGVDVRVFSRANVLLGGAVTDSQGLARIGLAPDPIQGGQRKPFAIIAKTSDDLTALRFSDLELSLAEYRVEGQPFTANKPYQAAIYADRGVYRPGETAHLVALVWEDGMKAAGNGLPLTAKLNGPRGKEVKKYTGRTNDAGMAGFDLAFHDFADTGRYSFVLEAGGAVLGEQPVMVEEFVPERMKVEVTAESEAVLATEPTRFTVKAQYLFGATPKGERVEAECLIEPDALKLDAFPGYVFSTAKMQPLALKTISGELDDKGEAALECPPAAGAAKLTGPARVKLTASVLEAGSGRATVSRASTAVHPGPWYVGLNTTSRSAKQGTAVEVQGVVIDWRGGLVADPGPVPVKIEEIYYEYGYRYNPQTGQSAYDRHERKAPVLDKSVKADKGRFTVSFTPDSWEARGYLVTAKTGDDLETALFIPGGYYNYYWDDEDYYYGSDQTPPPRAPGGIEIKAPTTVDVGEKAETVLLLPNPGRLLITVETDRVIDSRWYEVKAGTFTAPFTVSEMKPNVYVSALLIKDPAAESDKAFLPGRSFGVTSVKVRPKKHELTVTVTAPEEVTPNSTLEVEVSAPGKDGKVFATVAAVDEGILQLTGYRTPDVLSDLFKKCALGVGTYETVGWTMLMPPLSDKQAVGGDGGDEYGEQGASRPQPVKPVALWSGVVELDRDGKGKVTFAVPSYRGRLRVTAVAASKDAAGAGMTRVYVRDPLSLQPSFPRFLTSGDGFVVPVFVTNLTGKRASVEVSLSANAGAIIDDQNKKTISLDADQSGTVTFKCQAADVAFGVAELEATASSGPHLSRDQATVPVLSAAPTDSEVFVHTLTPGVNDLSRDIVGWVPHHQRTTVTVSGNKYIEEMKHLKYLIRYPYGCIEQTTSTTRPLLFIGNLVSAIDPEITRDGSIEEKFMYGVNRLLSMQTPSGGFSYWPGESYVLPWHTAYVAHLFMEARDAGYAIDKKDIDSAIAFIERALNGSENISASDLAAAEPYMQYVLARAGKARAKRAQELILSPNNQWGQKSPENLFLLKAALYIAGDRTYQEDLKKPAPSLLASGVQRDNDWTFWSSLRTRGLMLDIMEDLFPQNPGNETLANSIAAELKQQSYYYSTQDLAWCISGLGKRSGKAAREWSNPALKLDGKNVAMVPGITGPVGAWQIAGASQASSMVLNIDKIAGGELYALVRVEGIKLGSTIENVDNYIKVRRSYHRPDGSEANLMDLKLGELIYVNVSVENLSNQMIRNVAVTERFAAGLEIENPRLGRDHRAAWINYDSLWNLDYMNLRDDRVEVFGQLPAGGSANFIYVTRAVTGGRFRVPPVRAEAMYDPSIFSQQSGGTVIIHDPWNVIVD